jgi:hypothetical protein
MGTDVSSGDYQGTGLSGYTIGAPGGTASQAVGRVYQFDGTTNQLTQGYTNSDNAVYYQNTNNPTSGAHIATGSGNNDWVHGIGTHAQDSASGGRGNDHIGIVSTNFNGINGGAGTNTLEFERGGISLDLTKLSAKVQNFSQFDLNNQFNSVASDPQQTYVNKTAGNTLSLSMGDVLNVGTTSASTAGVKHTVTIVGDSTSTVHLQDTGWAQSSVTQSSVVNGTTLMFNVYTNHTAELLIQQGVHVA